MIKPLYSEVSAIHVTWSHIYTGIQCAGVGIMCACINYRYVTFQGIIPAANCTICFDIDQSILAA